MKYKYDIKYEHLTDELIKDDYDYFNFQQVKNSANDNRLELTDEEFRGLLEIQKTGKDIRWITVQMSRYKQSFTDALISYITY